MAREPFHGFGHNHLSKKQFYYFDNMEIAVLGWGSLVWEPKRRDARLRTKGYWYNDGPFLPIEYARISGNNELTLVIHPKARRVRTLWIYSLYHNLNGAIRNLQKREGIRL